MTLKTDTPRKPKRQRYSAGEAEALRLLAREAALRGESLASIRARLRLPESTLTVWARQDGYRQSDLAARAKADAAATRDEAAAIKAIREQADEMWQMIEDNAEQDRSPAQIKVELARVRALAFTEAGYFDAAEAEIAGVRRLMRLLAFARPVETILTALQSLNDWEAEAAAVREFAAQLVAEGEARREAEEAAAAREAAGLLSLPFPEPRPCSKEKEGESQDGELCSARARASTSLSMSAPNVPPDRDSS
jgi:hypothetical protein